jgi:hypothetical protein
MIWNTKDADDIEILAREIAGTAADTVALECARTIALTQIQVSRIRAAKAALISRDLVFGESAMPIEGKVFEEGGRDLLMAPQRVKTGLEEKSKGEPTAKVIERVLPELLKLDRYERRLAARRARAARTLFEHKNDIQSQTV